VLLQRLSHATFPLGEGIVSRAEMLVNNKTGATLANRAEGLRPVLADGQGRRDLGRAPDAAHQPQRARGADTFSEIAAGLSIENLDHVVSCLTDQRKSS
jgi:hypothetical protein